MEAREEKRREEEKTQAARVLDYIIGAKAMGELCIITCICYKVQRFACEGDVSAFVQSALSTTVCYYCTVHLTVLYFVSLPIMPISMPNTPLASNLSLVFSCFDCRTDN